MTWDASAFPHPVEMQESVASRGRKMVTIVDPHVKRDYSYYIHKEASDKKYYVRKKDGSEFEGWCWPGGVGIGEGAGGGTVVKDDKGTGVQQVARGGGVRMVRGSDGGPQGRA